MRNMNSSSLKILFTSFLIICSLECICYKSLQILDITMVPSFIVVAMEQVYGIQILKY